MGAAWLGEPLRRRCLLIGTLSQPSSRLLLPTTLHPHPIQVHSFTSPPASPHTESSAFSSRSQVQTVPSPGSAGQPASPTLEACAFFCFSHRSLTPSHHRNAFCLVAKFPTQHSWGQTWSCGLAWHCDCYFC